MKRTLLLAIMAGAALAGCVKNEPIGKGDSSPERITFDAPVVGVPVRATEIYGNYPKDKNFAVYALYHKGEYGDDSFTTGSMFMTNVTCTAKKADGSDVTVNTNDVPAYWAPATDYYWPKKGMLTFGAYAPAMTNTVSASNPDAESEKVKWDANGFTFKNFEVNEDPEQQIDLLYSDLVKNQTSEKMVTDKPYDGVTIQFKHALSSIVFKAKANVGPEETGNVKSITLTGITVNNVAKIGTFVQLPTPGWTINWAAAADVLTNYSVLKASKALGTSEVFVNGDVDGPGETYNNEEDELYPDDPNNTNNGVRRSDLIVIPQPLAGRDGTASNATVVIEYTIVYMNGGEVVTDENSYTFELGGKDNSATWEKGMRYIYTISIGLDEIHFNPQVQNWTDVESNIEI